MSKNDLLNMGVKDHLSKDAHETRHKANTRPNPKIMRGDIVEIKGKRITFPKDYWPSDCKYVQIIVAKNKKRVYLKPFLKKHSYTRSLEIRNDSYRVCLIIHEKISGSLDAQRDIELLSKTEKKGFFIKFTDKNDPLIELFEIWSKSGQSMVNTSKMTTYALPDSHKGVGIFQISIIETIWPKEAKFAYFELERSRSVGKDDYILVHPIPIVNKDLFSRCVKVRKLHHRIFMNAHGFLKYSFIPSGDWDLKEVLPSGALRFRLYKERQPKQKLEDVAS